MQFVAKVEIDLPFIVPDGGNPEEILKSIIEKTIAQTGYKIVNITKPE